MNRTLDPRDFVIILKCIGRGGWTPFDLILQATMLRVQVQQQQQSAAA